MSRGRILLLAVIAVALLTAFVLHDALRQREGGFDPGPVVSLPAEPEPEAEPPAPRRPLAVTGRLLGPGITPLAGWTIACGEQTATTDDDGRFELAEALRPRRSVVRCALGGKELVVWPDVLGGDAEPLAATPAVAALPADVDPAQAVTATEEGTIEPAPAPPAPAAPVQPLVDDSFLFPDRPELLRWTITLTAEWLTEVGPSALEPDRTLRLEHSFAEEWGNGTRIRLRGAANLPDGAHVQASLYFDGARFAGSLMPGEVLGRQFLVSMVCPRETRVFSGPYEARVSFNPVLERPADIEAWRQVDPGRDWDAEVPEASLAIFVGDPREHEAADSASLAYYTRLRLTAANLHRELKVRVAEAFAMARKVAPPERSGQLKVLRRVGRSVDADLFGASKVELQHREMFDETSRLKVEVWRSFLDSEWRPQVKALIAEHAERQQEKYPDHALALGSLLDALLDLSYSLSRFLVYPAFGLEPDERDFYPDEEAEGDLGRLETVVVEGLKKLEGKGAKPAGSR